jgi:hypothetical protein
MNASDSFTDQPLRDVTAELLRLRFAALCPGEQRAVFAYLAGRCPEHAAEALRLNEPDPEPQEISR